MADGDGDQIKQKQNKKCVYKKWENIHVHLLIHNKYIQNLKYKNIFANKFKSVEAILVLTNC